MNYYIFSESNDPFFNLAAEEYFLKQTNYDLIFFYINKPTVVVGKHQNAVAEANIPYLFKNNIILARRISGGGTVYHDEGNLNFSFIITGQQGKLVDFKKYTQIILNSLQTLQIPAEFGKRSDLTLNGKKISGNAEHVFKNRILHHGTLLFSSNLKNLNNSIHRGSAQITDNSVQSVRSEVGNISDLIGQSINIYNFTNQIINSIISQNSKMIPYHFSQSDLDTIKTLSINKYACDDWIYAYSPNYKFSKEYQFPDGKLRLKLWVEKGNIIEVKLSGNVFAESIYRKLEKKLKFIQHSPNGLKYFIDISIIEYPEIKSIINQFENVFF